MLNNHQWKPKHGTKELEKKSQSQSAPQSREVARLENSGKPDPQRTHRGERNACRPKMTWRRTVEKELTDMKLTWRQAADVAKDRTVWLTSERPMLQTELKLKEEKYFHL
jgi:hypothetical protein